MQAFDGNKMNWVRGVALEKQNSGNPTKLNSMLKVGVILARYYTKATQDYQAQAFRTWVNLKQGAKINQADAMKLLSHCLRHGGNVMLRQSWMKWCGLVVDYHNEQALELETQMQNELRQAAFFVIIKYFHSIAQSILSQTMQRWILAITTLKQRNKYRKTAIYLYSLSLRQIARFLLDRTWRKWRDVTSNCGENDNQVRGSSRDLLGAIL